MVIIELSNTLISLSSNCLPSLRLALIFTIVVLLVRLYFLKSSEYRKNLPPGPRGVPILGFLPFLNSEFHLTLTKLSEKFGPIYQIYLGRKRVVVLNDSKLVREAFRQQVFSGRPDTELTKILQGYGKLKFSIFFRYHPKLFSLKVL